MALGTSGKKMLYGQRIVSNTCKACAFIILYDLLEQKVAISCSLILCFQRIHACAKCHRVFQKIGLCWHLAQISCHLAQNLCQICTIVIQHKSCTKCKLLTACPSCQREHFQIQAKRHEIGCQGCPFFSSVKFSDTFRVLAKRIALKSKGPFRQKIHYFRSNCAKLMKFVANLIG